MLSPSVGTMLGMSTIGDRIKAAREAKGWNQAEFARQLGVKPPSITQLENGKTRRPASETLLRMRDAGINPDYIMKNKGPVLLAEAERSMREQTLVSMFRGMSEEGRAQIEGLAKVLRRATGKPGSDDPFMTDPPKAGDS
jgi:transcriptional regulator with XRE-family HTH domain